MQRHGFRLRIRRPGETLEELMEVAAAHGREVHQLDEITPEIMEMVQQVIREE